MKSRWIVNLVLLLLVAGMGLALKFMPEKPQAQPSTVTLSELNSDTFSQISIEAPAKNPVTLEKRDGRWWLVQPYKARADAMAVERVLSVVRAESVDKFDATDPARYGLDHPALKLKLGAEEFLFGTFNPVSGKQYVGFRNSVYLIESKYSESATTQVVEMLDKNLLAADEQIASFDFSRLEQWEEGGGLRMAMEKDQWVVTRPNTTAKQEELKGWFADSWGTLIAMSVEPYQPDHRKKYPSFEIKLKNGKTLHFDKESESPELILARPDEGLRYHFPQDVGFQILNPPVTATKS